MSNIQRIKKPKRRLGVKEMRAALAACGGDVSAAAAQLKMSPRDLAKQLPAGPW